MMKRLLCVFLTAAMLLNLAPVLAETAEGLPPMTTEEITLTFTTREIPNELLEYQAKKFMEAYPNIHVEVLGLDYSTFDATMANMASEGKLPDVLGLNWATDAVANGWLMCLDEFYEKDPDIADMSEQMKKYHEIDGNMWCVPFECRPSVCVLNRTLFEKYNVEVPDYDWTFDDFVDLVAELNHPEDYNYGFAAGYQLTNNFVYNYGWDGEKYTFGDDWVSMMERQIEWVSSGVTADSMTGEEKTAVLGDENADPMAMGHAAMAIVAQYSGYDYINGVNAEKSGCEFLFYPLPNYDDKAACETVPGGISATCQYPREAWELAKWMGWGPQATISRSEYFKEKGELDLNAPCVLNEKAMSVLIENAPEALKGFYQHMRQPITMAASTLPGSLNLVLLLWLGGWGEKMDKGEVTVAEAAVLLREEGVKGVQDSLNAIRKFTGK